jgi:hypothetical protein
LKGKIVKLRILKNLLVLGALGLALPVAHADEPGSVAKLTGADGTVMVDHGKGFVSAKPDTPLFENDRVITLDGSVAEITFSDGCRASLKANNLMAINTTPGCKAAIVDASKAAPVAAAPAEPLHPASFIPPLAGVGILIGILSVE